MNFFFWFSFSSFLTFLSIFRLAFWRWNQQPFCSIYSFHRFYRLLPSNPSYFSPLPSSLPFAYQPFPSSSSRRSLAERVVPSFSWSLFRWTSLKLHQLHSTELFILKFTSSIFSTVPQICLKVTTFPLFPPLKEWTWSSQGNIPSSLILYCRGAQWL